MLMTASTKDALERERGDLPVFGVEGRIMNEKFLGQFLENVHESRKRLGKEFRIFEFNTSQATKKKDTAEKVVTTVLDLVNELLSEHILCIEKEVITSELIGRSVVGADIGRRIAEL